MTDDDLWSELDKAAGKTIQELAFWQRYERVLRLIAWSMRGQGGQW